MDLWKRPLSTERITCCINATSPFGASSPQDLITVRIIPIYSDIPALSEPPAIKIALAHDNPETTAAIGTYFISFAALEFALWGMAAKSLGTTPDGAISLLGWVQSIKHRIDAIARFAEYSDYSDTLKAEMKDITGELSACIRFRNKIAHGLYNVDDIGCIHVTNYVTDPTKKTSEPVALTLSKMAEEQARLEAVYGRVIAFSPNSER